jgi:hypothetical protein
MRTEPPPFGNVALCADTDRVYHRIGAIGNDGAELPQMSASATIQPDGDGNWNILEDEEVRATYPSRAIRFSVLWKAEVRNGNSRPDNLTLDRIMAILTADLRHRGIDFHKPSDPLADISWILLLQRIYAPHCDSWRITGYPEVTPQNRLSTTLTRSRLPGHHPEISPKPVSGQLREY